MTSYYFALFSALVGVAKLARITARYLAENAIIRVKPFNCAPCLSFWLCLAGGAFLIPQFVSSIAGGASFAGVLCVAGWLNYLYEKSKIKIEE